MSYETYVKMRDDAKMKDSEVARRAGIHQSVLTDWKKGKSQPKVDKMQRIAEAIGVPLIALVGSMDNVPARPKTKLELFDEELLRLYHNATPDAQTSVLTLLRNSQREKSFDSLKEA